MSLAGDYDLQVGARVPELDKLNALLPSLQLPLLHRMSLYPSRQRPHAG